MEEQVVTQEQLSAITDNLNTILENLKSITPFRLKGYVYHIESEVLCIANTLGIDKGLVIPVPAKLIG